MRGPLDAALPSDCSSPPFGLSRTRAFMRPVVYFVATTLDGFIAREDGSFDAFPWDDEYGAELFASFPETIPVHIRGDGHDRSGNR